MPYIKLFLKSLPIITNNFNTEIIVVDRYSNDGTYELLKDIADIIVQEDSYRGQARQKAMELSHGDVLINHLDIDEEIQPLTKEIIKRYISKKRNYCLSCNGFLIGYRDLMFKAKYPNVHICEDRMFLRQLYDLNILKCLKGCSKPVLHTWGTQPKRNGPIGNWNSWNETLAQRCSIKLEDL